VPKKGEEKYSPRKEMKEREVAEPFARGRRMESHSLQIREEFAERRRVPSFCWGGVLSREKRGRIYERSIMKKSFIL